MAPLPLAAGSAAAEHELVPLSRWGTYCDIGVSGVNGCDGKFDRPWGVAVGRSGSIYVVDQDNHRIEKYGGPWFEVLVGEPELLSRR